MRNARYLAGGLIALLACALAAGAREHGKYHHDLRGKVTSVEPAKNQFTFQTNQGEVAVCVIDEKSEIRRDGRKIKLDEVRPGERAYCHCAALKNGKHYSVELLITQKDR